MSSNSRLQWPDLPYSEMTLEKIEADPFLNDSFTWERLPATPANGDIPAMEEHDALTLKFVAEIRIPVQLASEAVDAKGTDLADLMMERVLLDLHELYPAMALKIEQRLSQIRAEKSHCSDERPCTPCYTDNGACEDKPNATTQAAMEEARTPGREHHETPDTLFDALKDEPKDGTS